MTPGVTLMLKEGDIVEVHGWVMLSKLEPGVYRISRVSSHYDIPTYSFSRQRGKKVICRHYAGSVNSWLRPEGHSDLNKIVVRKEQQ